MQDAIKVSEWKIIKIRMKSYMKRDNNCAHKNKLLKEL